MVNTFIKRAIRKWFFFDSQIWLFFVEIKYR